MPVKSFVVKNEVGLHARPAALFVQTAAKFKASTLIRNITRNTPFVDAKSILNVMGLGVSKGHEIELKIEGTDEQATLEAMSRLIESDFADGV